MSKQHDDATSDLPEAPESAPETNPEAEAAGRATDDAGTDVNTDPHATGDSGIELEDAPELDAEAASEQVQSDPQTELLKQIEALQDAVTAEKNARLRAVADLDNFRKRALREKEEIRKYGALAFIEEMLPAIDNLELGLIAARSHHPEAKSLLDGLNMVITQMNGVLEGNGVQEVNPVGRPFDPNLHEGVSHVTDAEIPEGSVISVNRKGYMLHDRLIRPAMVVVSSGQPEDTVSEAGEADVGDAEATGDET